MGRILIHKSRCSIQTGSYRTRLRADQGAGMLAWPSPRSVGPNAMAQCQGQAPSSDARKHLSPSGHESRIVGHLAFARTDALLCHDAVVMRAPGPVVFLRDIVGCRIYDSTDRPKRTPKVY